jgi:hypothetical protein
MPVPTVPRPLSDVTLSRTEPTGDSRFGFRLSSPRQMRDVSPLAGGGTEIPIDPVLLAESQYQSSLRPPLRVYHSSSSRAHQRQGPTPLLSGQNPVTGDRSNGQATSTDIHTSLDSDSGDDSEDEIGVDESDGSDSQDQDTGAEYNTHHDLDDPTLGAFRFCETGPTSYPCSTRL